MGWRMIGLAAMLAWPSAAPAQTARTEVVREVFSEIGRKVAVSTPTGPGATIEWRQRVEVRARTATGAALSPEGRAEALGRATCPRGRPQGATEAVEPNGTLVIALDCARIQ